MTLDDLTAALFARTTRGIRMGIERTEKLLAGVGNPHRLFRSVLIGGTNGKGSVAALSEAALREDGRARVGLYTSPHLMSFAERIQINGVPVGEGELIAAAERLMPHLDATGASFFEATTALAFMIFADAGVELAVTEVGLGGRLDATNVLHPLVGAITNVARDHAEYLGDDLASIAREKGGILKRDVDAVVGVDQPEVIEIMRERSADVGARFHLLDDLATITNISTARRGTEFHLRSRFWGDRSVRIALAGAHQARNAALAAELLGLLPPNLRPDWDAVARGFANVRWPGRMQIENIGAATVVFDVAHNPAGAVALAASLDALDLPEPRVLLFGALADKDWRAMLSTLVPRASATVLTIPPTAPESRRWVPTEAADWIAAAFGTNVRARPDFDAALREAIELAGEGTILVTGSIHTVGDAMVSLGP